MKRRLPPLTAPSEHLKAAARLGSFREAAEELSVSRVRNFLHQVNNLEEQAGDSNFFVRTPARSQLSGRRVRPIFSESSGKPIDRIRMELNKLLSSAGRCNILTVQMFIRPSRSAG